MRQQKLNKAKGKINLNYKVDKNARQSCAFYQQQPSRVLFPRMDSLGITGAVLINTAGGVVGGDTYDTRILLERGTKAFVTTQAAEKIYGSSHSAMQTNIRTCIKAEKDSWLEWVPQETIIFNRAQLKRQTSIHACPGSKIMAGEILVFGRTSRGETFCEGKLWDKWAIYWEKDLVWQDTLILRKDDTLAALTHPAGFDGATAYATFVYVSSEAPGLLETAREFLQTCVTRNYVAAFDHLLVVRWLSTDTLQLREDYGRFWGFWRHNAGNLPGIMPKTWYF